MGMLILIKCYGWLQARDPKDPYIRQLTNTQYFYQQ